jgi:hypothetical protein
MLPFGAPAVAAGQVLGTAFACGLNLYATVAFLGLASRLGWFDGLPPGLRGLENPIIIGSAIALYLIESVIDKLPYVEAVWDGVHTLIRPLAAGALALLALQTAPDAVQWAAGAGAALAALAAHGAKAGLRLRAGTPRRRSARYLLSLLEDGLALGLVAVALLVPTAATGAAAAVMLVLLIGGPGLWRAAVLGARATAARFRGFFGTAGWRDADAMPPAIRGLLLPDALGLHPPRVTRAALLGHGVGGFRGGWLVIDQGNPTFLYRTLLGPRRLDLAPTSAPLLRRGLLTDVVELDAGPRLTLYLLKDGPPVEAALAELRPGPP